MTTAANANAHPISVESSTRSPYTKILEMIAPIGTININTPVRCAPTLPAEAKKSAVLSVPGKIPIKRIVHQNVAS